jgi:hypothetical protein
MRQLFEAVGFWLLKVADLKNSRPLAYWLKLLFKSDKANKAVKWLGLSSISFPLAVGNIYIIAKK